MKRKKSTYLKEENLLILLSQNNFIVPEIQREYVWGSYEEGKILKIFVEKLKKKMGVCCTSCNQPSLNEKINIGFLYSYKPDYVKIEQDRFLDEYLIDGQQRFTTLFLLLFYCALKEKRKNEFLSLIRFEEKLSMSFDFKVRDLTRRFLLELVEKTNSISEISEIKEQTWFLKDYRNDTSIQAIINALVIINEAFSHKVQYYNHLLNNIVFWHFKTEATSQGEELYITMNARGEPLKTNEVEKAELMADGLRGEEILIWGKKWEEWQQFFWKNRNKKNTYPNADYGFNEFLSWNDEISRHLKETDEDFSAKGKFDKIQLIFEAFEFLVNYQEKEIDHLKNGKKLKISELFDFKNLVQLKEENTNIESKNKLTLYASLMYVVQRKPHDSIKLLELYRFIRVINNTTKYHLSDYHLYDNKNRGRIIGIESALQFKELPFTDIAELFESSNILISKEESLKLEIYKKNPNTRKEIEAVFWTGEEHKLNFRKIEHLIQLSFYKSPLEFEKNEKNIKYNIDNFNFERYKKLQEIQFKFLCNSEELTTKLRGNFIWSSLYKYEKWNNRIVWKGGEKKKDKTLKIVRNEDFLKMLLEFDELSIKNVDDYLDKREKSFIQQYSREDIFDIKDPKRQLYIYFILLNNNEKWDWWKGNNFGLYTNPVDIDSFFNVKIKFQHYNKAWHDADKRVLNYSLFSTDEAKATILDELFGTVSNK